MTTQCPTCKLEFTNNNFNKHFNSCRGKLSWFVRNRNGLYTAPTPIKKYELSNYDWEEIQQFYDGDHTFMEVCKKFNFNTTLLSRAKSEGLFKTRKRSDTARVRGKYNNLKLSQETKSKIGNSIADMIASGKISPPHFKRSMHKSWLGNIESLHSSWETIVANYLDSHKIHWVKSKDKFPYIHKGVNHIYLPDFYLKDFNLYIEVKGFQREKDASKWEQFPQKMLIIDKTNINNLEEFFIFNKIIEKNSCI
jgi:hypothetical protein